MSELTQYQKFEMETLDRSAIKTADYNPRTISGHAQRQLKGVLKDVGLLQPLIWNRRTGTLVSGHQRLASLDALERYAPGGKKSYSLQVAVVDLDEKEERRMNVFLNNQSAMGEFDLDKLADLQVEFDISAADMGFSLDDIDVMFPEATAPIELGDTAEAQRAKNVLGDIKGERKAAKEGLENAQNIGYYFTVICPDLNAKERLLEALGVPGYEEYVRGELIAAQCGVTLAE